MLYVITITLENICEGKRNTYNYSIDIQHKDRYGIIQCVYVAEIERAQICNLDGWLFKCHRV